MYVYEYIIRNNVLPNDIQKLYITITSVCINCVELYKLYHTIMYEFFNFHGTLSVLRLQLSIRAALCCSWWVIIESEAWSRHSGQLFHDVNGFSVMP